MTTIGAEQSCHTSAKEVRPEFDHPILRSKDRSPVVAEDVLTLVRTHDRAGPVPCISPRIHPRRATRDDEWLVDLLRHSIDGPSQRSHPVGDLDQPVRVERPVERGEIGGSVGSKAIDPRPRWQTRWAPNDPRRPELGGLLGVM